VSGALALSAEQSRDLERRLQPYGLRLVEQAAELALRLHADEVGAEHLLCALMADEDCAAYRAAVYAFADPPTVGEEALAMAAGILISGSAASTPFSTGAVRALEAARDQALALSEAQARPGHLLEAAVAALPDELRAEVLDAGYRGAETAAAPRSVPVPGGLFRIYSESAKKALSAAARLARQEHSDAIGPAHLALACLLEEPELARQRGLSASRARMIFRGRFSDPTPTERRALAPDESFTAFLAGLERASGSLELLARFHAGGTPELAKLLARHRLIPALLERAAGAFADPEA
jgi:Clp amino terminal domain, pathogenicity island component